MNKPYRCISGSVSVSESKSKRTILIPIPIPTPIIKRNSISRNDGLQEFTNGEFLRSACNTANPAVSNALPVRIVKRMRLSLKNYNDHKGIALVTALLLTLIGLAIILAAAYFVIRGAKVSGFQKRYATALEASDGGVQIMTNEIIGRTIGGTALSSLGTYGGMLVANVTDGCFNTKLTTATNSWGACNIGGLSASNSPDITLTLNGTGGSANFTVYAKIVDTVPGNSDTSGISLLGSGVVQSGSGMITPQHFPYIYRVEVQGQRQTNPDEKANLSAVYAY